MFSGIIAVALVTFFAFTVKGATGFGPAIFVIGILSVLIGSQEAIVLAAALDLSSGAWMYFNERKVEKGNRPVKTTDWLPLAITMALFASAGGLLLQGMTPTRLSLTVGIVILAAGLWFLADRVGLENLSKDAKKNLEAIPAGLSIAALSGLLGGLVGIGGPTLIAYLGAIYDKERFRAILVPILMISALARVLTYSVLGLFSYEHLFLTLIALPGMFVGVKFGTYIFNMVNETLFWRLSGILLILIAILKIYQGQ